MLKNEAIQAVEENISVFFFKFGVGKGFLTLTQNPEAIKKELINLTTKKKTFKNSVQPKTPQAKLDKCQSARKYLQHIHRQNAISLNTQRLIKNEGEKDQSSYRKIHKKPNI